MRGWEKYIKGVQTGKILCGEHIKQAVARFEAFRNRSDIYFDAEAVKQAAEFIFQMKHFLGKSAGKNFELQPWQEFLLANIIGLKWKATGLRVCRETYIQVARKAGKDAFMAALALYMLIVDGEAAPEIGCLANSREQARILFDYITNFAKSLDPKGNVLDYYRNYVSFPTNNGKVKVFSADASKLDGLNISLGIIDEYHEAKDRKLYDVMKSSQGMRTQPLMVIITTAGFNLESPCHDMYELSIEILAGVKTDDTFFAFIFDLDDEDNWEDPKNFIKVQPNLGVTVTTDFMEAEVLKAKNDATAVVGVMTKTFNKWCQSMTVWIPQETIVKQMKVVALEDYVGSTAYIGTDLGSVSDFTSLSIMIPSIDKYVFKTWTFIPNETYKKHQDKELYQKFVKEGTMIVTPGNVTDYDYVIRKISELNEMFSIEGIYYDQWNSTSWAIKCTELGYPMKPYSQAIGNFNKPTTEFERLVKSDNVIIDKSSNILWQFGNVELKQDHNGNCLSLDTLVPTPDGFKKINEIEIGDYVYSYDGTPTKVIDTTDINYDRDCYKLTFMNGSEVIADCNHQWYVNVSKTKTENGKKKSYWDMDYRSTEWLYNHYVNAQGNKCRHTIMNGAVQYSDKHYSIDPYVLGLWLGDGTSKSASFTVHTGDTEMYDYVTDIYGTPNTHKDKREDRQNYIELSFTGKTLYRQLSSNNLIGNKHIPEEYMYGSVQQRLSLVQGLMDTDGCCNKTNGECSFSQKRKCIIDGLAVLLDSLGVRHSSITSFEIKGKTYYRMIWHTNVPMFRLKRKLDIQNSIPASKLNDYNPIINIEKVDSVPTKCITVEDEKHLFLVTDKYLVTGNCKPDKGAYRKKIDSVISMLTSLGGYLNNPIAADTDIVFF